MNIEYWILGEWAKAADCIPLPIPHSPLPTPQTGGSVWESNPPEPPKAPTSGFEGHRRKPPGSPSLGKTADSALYVSLPDPTYPPVLLPICYRGGRMTPVSPALSGHSRHDTDITISLER